MKGRGKKKSYTGWIRDDWEKRYYIGMEADGEPPTVQIPNIFKYKSSFNRKWIPAKAKKVRITIEEIKS